MKKLFLMKYPDDSISIYYGEPQNILIEIDKYCLEELQKIKSSGFVFTYPAFERINSMKR